MESEGIKPTPPSTRIIKEGEIPPRKKATTYTTRSISRKLFFYAFFSGVFVLMISLIPTTTIWQGVVSFITGVGVFVLGFGCGCWFSAKIPKDVKMNKNGLETDNQGEEIR